MLNSSASCNTPDCHQTCLPFLNRIIVGRPFTWYFEARAWFLSTSIFIMEIALPNVSFNCFKIGLKTLQGPHHSA